MGGLFFHSYRGAPTGVFGMDMLRLCFGCILFGISDGVPGREPIPFLVLTTIAGEAGASCRASNTPTMGEGRRMRREVGGGYDDL
jgi:hypothetical protein